MDLLSQEKILVTGATGYVGGRLVSLLLNKGYKVRCFVFGKKRLKRPGWEKADIVNGDILQYETLSSAMKGVSIAYYLVHPMSADKQLEKPECTAARNFAQAAKEAGVKRIIYLSSLADENIQHSGHLETRSKTATILRDSGIPVTEFQAGQIIGSGSLAFELLRQITEILPVILVPRWAYSKLQPIAVRDILRYLSECIALPETVGRTLQIGGSTVLSYLDMISIYAKLRGLKRPYINLPYLTSFLTAVFTDILTAIPQKMALPIIEILQKDAVLHDNVAESVFNFVPLSFEEAVSLATENTYNDSVETAWFSTESYTQKTPLLLKESITKYKLEVEAVVEATPEAVFRSISCIGGKNGWYFANRLWSVRAFIDRIAGGWGFRRGRRSLKELREWDIIDFWRVEELDENKLIIFRSEMKMPGQTWLLFEIVPVSPTETTLILKSFYEPGSFWGHIFWYVLLPAHPFLYKGMLKEIAAVAREDKEC